MLLTVRCIKIGAFNNFNMISRKMMDNVRLSKATISMKNIDGSHKHALLNNVVFYFSKFHVYQLILPLQNKEASLLTL